MLTVASQIPNEILGQPLQLLRVIGRTDIKNVGVLAVNESFFNSNLNFWQYPKNAEKVQNM